MNESQETPTSPTLIEMYSLTGKPIAARLIVLSVSHSSESNEATCTLQMELDYVVWKEVLTNESFNLFRELISQSHLPDFDSKSPVLLEARLRIEVLQSENSLQLADTFQNAAKGKERAHPLLQTESWLAMTVTQQVELPPDIGENAFAHIGFRTTWAETKSIAESEQQASLLRFTNEYFSKQGYKVESLGDGILRTQVNFHNRNWVVMFLADEEGSSLSIWSLYPSLIPEGTREKLGLVLLGLNYETAVGGFEMDPEDGEIRFRTALALGGLELKEQPLEELL